MNTTNLLMVLAVVAVVASAVAVVYHLPTSQTGMASTTPGNVTLEIAQVLDINFTRQIINWSSGYVNTSCGTNAILDTNNTASPIICGSSWAPQTNGLILESLSSLPIAINLSSTANASTLIDGGNNLGSTFRWKVQEFNFAGVGEPLTCDATLAPTVYTDIQSTGQIRICNNTRYESDRDELRIDFQVNISQLAPALVGYRTAQITATAWLP